MHLKSLKIFCDTVSLRSFSKAADENHVSQSNASQVVHQLEERVGALLIDRSTRPFRVTPAGEKYYQGCRALVRQYDDLEREVKAMHGAASTRLAVGAIYSVGLAHLSSCVDEFHAQHPEAEVRVEYWRPDRVYTAVEQEEVELGIVSYPAKSRHLAVEAWRDESFAVACPPEHRLAGAGPAAIESLRGESFVAFDRGLLIREKIDRLLAKHKVEVSISCEFDNIENMKRAIETGAGVGLLPAPTVSREVTEGTLVAVRLTDPTIVRPLGIIYRRDRELSGVAKEFIELLQAHASDAALRSQPVAPASAG